LLSGTGSLSTTTISQPALYQRKAKGMMSEVLKQVTASLFPPPSKTSSQTAAEKNGSKVLSAQQGRLSGQVS
jgi:hypothetical protein